MKKKEEVIKLKLYDLSAWGGFVYGKANKKKILCGETLVEYFDIEDFPEYIYIKLTTKKVPQSYRVDLSQTLSGHINIELSNGDISTEYMYWGGEEILRRVMNTFKYNHLWVSIETYDLVNNTGG